MKVRWESDLCFKHTIWLWGSEGKGGNWLRGDDLRSGLRDDGLDLGQSRGVCEVDGFERGTKRLSRACTLLSWLADFFR